MKLNLGAGSAPIEGYVNLDHKTDDEIYPLKIEDNSVDEVRASHVLEHFSHHIVADVIAEWVRVLKPGGVLKIAVPDFEWIARKYLDGADVPIQGYLMGGQVDGDDFHATVFDQEALAELLTKAGLVDITVWNDGVSDCSALEVSLNLCGTKPALCADRIPLRDFAKNVGAAMSVPRLGFMDNFFCAFQALVPLGIGLRKQTGAFWGQCLTRAIEEWIKEGKEWVLTVDYDTLYQREDVEALLRLAIENPDVDAIAPVQASRTRAYPLMTIRGPDGRNLSEVAYEVFEPDLTSVDTAHFGLTLIRVAALERMPKPWFLGKPDAKGSWGDDRTDDDIYFWHKFVEAGNVLKLANRVTVGHAELMVRWPGRDFAAIWQHPSDFWSNGKPEDVWQ